MTESKVDTVMRELKGKWKTRLERSKVTEEVDRGITTTLGHEVEVGEEKSI